MRLAADFTTLRWPAPLKSMNTTPHDFVTVDMRGLKATLVARARERRVSVSVVVREALARELGADLAGGSQNTSAVGVPGDSPDRVKVSLRFMRSEVQRLDVGAHAAGLSRTAFLVGLVDGVPVLRSGASRPEHLALLSSSCAELATLSRNVHRLTELLRVGDVQGALAYRNALLPLDEHVRTHLRLAATVLAELRAPGDVPAVLRRRPSRRRSV